jgi:hypothetical protein
MTRVVLASITYFVCALVSLSVVSPLIDQLLFGVKPGDQGVVLVCLISIATVTLVMAYLCTTSLQGARFPRIRIFAAIGLLSVVPGYIFMLLLACVS